MIAFCIGVSILDYVSSSFNVPYPSFISYFYCALFNFLNVLRPQLLQLSPTHLLPAFKANFSQVIGLPAKATSLHPHLTHPGRPPQKKKVGNKKRHLFPANKILVDPAGLASQWPYPPPPPIFMTHVMITGLVGLLAYLIYPYLFNSP